MARSGAPSLGDLLLAFRQAKTAIAAEQGVVGLFDLARFEANLGECLKKLRGALKQDRWFDRIELGKLVVVPKSATPTDDEKPDIVQIGGTSSPKMRLDVRLQLEPSAEFAITEVLYLWEFGGALEALLNDRSSVGYRLKNVRRRGAMDRNDRAVYDFWPKEFERYRKDPIIYARRALAAGKRVVITSTDVVSFFDSIDPTFLLTAPFVRTLEAAARTRARAFSTARYLSATRSLLKRFGEFRRLRVEPGGVQIDTRVGVPIGAFTSRVIANVALASLDKHIEAQPGVILYRRYVDDIVIVTSHDASASVPSAKTEVLRSLFPQFKAGKPHRFVVPFTGATFALKADKTRVHNLIGQPGVDFLVAVEQSFSAVSSERRAFLGNVDRLTNDIEAVDLFSDTAAGTDRIPRLRDADRFTLRRFMATAYLAGLQRSAMLLDAPSANAFLETHASRMLSILEGSTLIEDFDLALSLLKVSLLCSCRSVAQQVQVWLRHKIEPQLSSQVVAVYWREHRLRRPRALDAVKRYLRRRTAEATASATALRPLEPSDDPLANGAPLLRLADLRHLDREDDAEQFGVLALPRLASIRKAHSELRAATREDRELQGRFKEICGFVSRSHRLGEAIWNGVSAVSLLLSVKPPRYVDVARRFLARLELSPAVAKENLGRAVDRCVDALRGTRYASRWTPSIQVGAARGRATLRVDSLGQPSAVRVILANLPVTMHAFVGGAIGPPLLTVDRLRTLDQALRDAQRAARAADRSGIPSLLVLPELSIPRRWVRSLVDHAVKERLTVVAGIEYEATDDGLVNQALGVFPLRRRVAATVRWTKRYPARGEEAALQKIGMRFRTAWPTGIRRLVVESAHGRTGVLICSEILEAPALSALRGAVELLLVPAWNDDTPSFDHVVHAASSMLVHAFVCVANNAGASDSRIVAPIREPRHLRDWCRLVHRGETQVIWGDLPLAELRTVHAGIALAPPLPGEKERVYRPLPPGWESTAGKPRTAW